MKPYYLLEPGDRIEEGDEYFSPHQMMWTPSIDAGGNCGNGRPYRRPIPDALPPDDGWISWGGGECPVDPETVVAYKTRSGDVTVGSYPARTLRWQHGTMFAESNDIISYLVVVKAPEPQWLPLTCDDVPPGSYLRPKTDYVGWIVISEIDAAGVHLHGGRSLTYADLLERKWEILRPGEDWQPCRKLAK